MNEETTYFSSVTPSISIYYPLGLALDILSQILGCLHYPPPDQSLYAGSSSPGSRVPSEIFPIQPTLLALVLLSSRGTRVGVVVAGVWGTPLTTPPPAHLPSHADRGNGAPGPARSQRGPAGGVGG